MEGLPCCILYMIPYVFPRNRDHYTRRLELCQRVICHFSQFFYDFIS